MSEFATLTGRVADGVILSRGESARAFELMADGAVTPAQMAGFLMALRTRGETIEEITGAVTTMRGRMLTVDAPPDAIDVVGTGGDASGSYNISTCAAFVVAGGGVPVAKHGNRALSSRCGAADVLRELGVCIDLDPAAVGRCIREVGIGFMFAPAHHPALRHVGPTRAELGTRTVFNLLGPMLNPAGVRRHMIGVYARQWVEPVARVLGALGSERAMVVHGSDGLDELTTTGPTSVGHLVDGAIRTFETTPEDAGLSRVWPEALRGGSAVVNAAALRAVLNGRLGPYRDVTLLNAAAAFVVAGRADDLREGVIVAAGVLDDGRALARLQHLVALSNGAATIDEQVRPRRVDTPTSVTGA